MDISYTRSCITQIKSRCINPRDEIWDLPLVVCPILISLLMVIKSPILDLLVYTLLLIEEVSGHQVESSVGERSRTPS